MKFHMVATLPHYRRHVEAVWRHFPDDLKGEQRLGRTAVRERGRHWAPDDVVLAGSHVDAELISKQRVVYVEHGAGQAYAADPHSRSHPSYHGARHRGHVAAYIAPRQDVADSWRKPAFAAGCPVLDGVIHRPASVALLAWHWDARQVCQEARTARQHYQPMLQQMVDKLARVGFQVMATGHPKDSGAEARWLALGVPFVADSHVALAAASVLIADNTSLMYEAALLDVPVVALNAPWYRRHVEHGLRFWEFVPGTQIDSPEQFMDLNVVEVLTDPQNAVYRRFAAAYAYGGNPGGAAAARWLIDQFADS